MNKVLEVDVDIFVALLRFRCGHFCHDINVHLTNITNILSELYGREKKQKKEVKENEI